LPGKIEIIRKFAWKSNFLLASTTPKISNQIDATDGLWSACYNMYTT